MSMLLWFMAGWIVASIVVALGLGRVMSEKLPEEIEGRPVLVPAPVHAKWY